MEDFVKIVFELEIDEDGFPPVGTESLNARAAGTGFVLDNTPFFATGVALGDRVEALHIPGSAGGFTFVRVIEASTTKAISIIFLDEECKDAVFQELKRRGCYCEYGEFGANAGLQMLAVAVPESCDYATVSGYLGPYESNDQLSVAELAI